MQCGHWGHSIEQLAELQRSGLRWCGISGSSHLRNTSGGC
jgi:hypothetical protein